MSWDTKKAIEQLVLGRELTNQLRDLLNKSSTDETVLLASVSEDLVIKIRNTFADTLSLLKNNGHGYYNHDDEVSDQKLKIRNNSSDGLKSEDSTDSIKSTLPTLNDKRGSYKRRKGVEPVKKIISALIDDGYAWRKYGQKQILHSKNPRSYYRCTHKTEQNCQATKQVQQIEDDPPKYEIIYHGHHTCKNNIKASQFIVDDSGTCDDSPFMFSFANNNVISNKQVHHPFLSSFSSVKKESKEEYRPISEISTYNGSSSTSEYVLSPTMDHHLTTTFDPSVLSGSGDDHDDIFSGVVDSVDLDDFYFSFDGDSYKA